MMVKIYMQLTAKNVLLWLNLQYTFFVVPKTLPETRFERIVSENFLKFFIMSSFFVKFLSKFLATRLLKTRKISRLKYLKKFFKVFNKFLKITERKVL